MRPYAASGTGHRSLTPERFATFLQPEQIATGPHARTGENIGIWLDHPIELLARAEELPSSHR